MKHVLIFGAGKIGSAIARMLLEHDDYNVTVIDRDLSTMIDFDTRAHLIQEDITVRFPSEFETPDAVINAGPHFLNQAIIEWTIKNGYSYFDLTESVEDTNFTRKLVSSLEKGLLPRNVIPQCGLAPGFVSIAANDLASKFDDCCELITIRVGALPENPNNKLKYNLTWSTDGLINECIKPGIALKHGEMVTTTPLEELETFSIDGVEYEAFNTSGGLGSLGDSLKICGVNNANYKTIRYPGHRDLFKFMAFDMKLYQDPDMFKLILETAIPSTRQDVVLIKIAGVGEINGKYTEETQIYKIYGDDVFSAIQRTTAAGVCAVVDMTLTGVLPEGFLRQEDIDLDAFLGNRFGKNYVN